MIRVLLADDQALVRNGFRLILERDDEIDVVGEAEHGDEAVGLARTLQPDVVLMDVRMPGTDGIAATRRLIDNPAFTGRVLMLTTFDLDEYVYGALRAGASGFLLKDTSAADLLVALRVVAAGDALLAPSVTRRLIAAFGAQPRPSRTFHPTLSGVTEREREILVLIARGLSNTDIAAHLTLSVATVKSHVGRLLTKLHARDRAQLVVVAYETGLVTASRTDPGNRRGTRS
jgi:DNA-binding NarL/FixJ family response regulator